MHHPKCPRSKLYSQLIMYLGPNEREAFEVVVEDGKLLYRKSGVLVNTTEDSKWIFVLSTTRSLYVGQKKKGKFQHSSFLAGAATTAAGRLVAKDGVLKAIWPYSGHYLPTEENFREFISFLEENSVDLADVKRCSVDDDEFPSFKKTDEQPEEADKPTEPTHDEILESSQVELPEVDIVKEVVVENSEDTEAAPKMVNRPSFKWATANGARIGWGRGYPAAPMALALAVSGTTRLISRAWPLSMSIFHQEWCPLQPQTGYRYRLLARAPRSGCHLGFTTWVSRRLPVASSLSRARRSGGHQGINSWGFRRRQCLSHSQNWGSEVMP
uniref:Uncharacterized protein n=1 Tax=Oryza brachyantha TaxID=4533 RepID=J3L179_ORYBR